MPVWSAPRRLMISSIGRWPRSTAVIGWPGRRWRSRCQPLRGEHPAEDLLAAPADAW